jgi:hypothetical protein
MKAWHVYFTGTALFTAAALIEGSITGALIISGVALMGYALVASAGWKASKDFAFAYILIAFVTLASRWPS